MADFQKNDGEGNERPEKRKAPPYVHDPQIIDCNKGLKSRKIESGSVYRITPKSKAKQITLKVIWIFAFPNLHMLSSYRKY